MRLSEELRGRTKQYTSAIIRFNMSVFQIYSIRFVLSTFHIPVLS